MIRADFCFNDVFFLPFTLLPQYLPDFPFLFSEKYFPAILRRKHHAKRMNDIKEDMCDIIAIVLFAGLANANEWMEMLKTLNVKGHIITTDAMGTQTKIVKQIRKKHADYVLALKGNQTGMYDDISRCFQATELLAACAYTYTIEKARGGVEKREYWQTSDIAWLGQRKKWVGLQSIAMTRNTVTKNDTSTVEERYFIGSLPLDGGKLSLAFGCHVQRSCQPNR